MILFVNIGINHFECRFRILLTDRCTSDWMWLNAYCRFRISFHIWRALGLLQNGTGEASRSFARLWLAMLTSISPSATTPLTPTSILYTWPPCFWIPYFSQMLSPTGEEEALDYLKNRVFLKDSRSLTPETSSSAGSNTSSSGTSSSTVQEEDGGPSIPKRLHLFKFVKMPAQSGTFDRDRSFDVRFRNDIKKVQELFEPLR